MDVTTLLAAMAATPDLPGAACVGERDTFDACTERGAHRAYAIAIRICAGCPALADCARWIDSLPPEQRPHGVTAGRITTSRRIARSAAHGPGRWTR